MSNQGHWIGLKADTKNYFGFIYIIRDITSGRKYIGKKQFFGARRVMKGCKSKITDRQSPKWKTCCWREMAWRVYSGSSKSLDKWMTAHPDHKYVFEIIHLCRSKGVLHYLELKEMWERDVLRLKLESGEYEYFNRSIGAIRFRPPEFQTKESIKKSTRHGEEHGMFKDEKKELVNTKTYETFHGTRYEFKQLTGFTTNCVSGLFNEKYLSRYGWRLSCRLGERKGHCRRDNKIYMFVHDKSGESFEGLRVDFCKAFPEVRTRDVTAVVNGKQKTTKGWHINIT